MVTKLCTNESSISTLELLMCSVFSLCAKFANCTTPVALSVWHFDIWKSFNSGSVANSAKNRLCTLGMEHSFSDVNFLHLTIASIKLSLSKPSVMWSNSILPRKNHWINVNWMRDRWKLTWTIFTFCRKRFNKRWNRIHAAIQLQFTQMLET